jgi:hypothetical protein
MRQHNVWCGVVCVRGAPRTHTTPHVMLPHVRFKGLVNLTCSSVITQHNEQHKMKPTTNAKVSFIVLKTICSSIHPIYS